MHDTGHVQAGDLVPSVDFWGSGSHLESVKRMFAWTGAGNGLLCVCVQASSRKAPPQHLDDVGAAGASSNGAGTQSSVKIGAGGTRQEAVPAGIAEVEREVHTDNLQESSSER